MKDFTFIPESLISDTSRKWVQCDSLKSSEVLKLGLLRDLKRSIHAEQSKYLSLGKRQEAVSLKNLENHLDELREAENLNSPLAYLLSGQATITTHPRSIPASFSKVIPPEKLNRYDRVWEKALVSWGLELGWSFWTLKAFVQVALAENWERSLAQKLWPNGISLYVEALHHPKTKNKGIWYGAWKIMAHPKIQTFDDLGIKFETLPGVHLLISEPEWQKDFP